MPSLEEILMKRQLRWIGHVIRQPEHRLPHRVLYGELATGRRNPGGQKKRLKDNTKAYLKNFGMNPNTLEEDAADRQQWCAKVSYTESPASFKRF